MCIGPARFLYTAQRRGHIDDHIIEHDCAPISRIRSHLSEVIKIKRSMSAGAVRTWSFFFVGQAKGFAKAFLVIRVVSISISNMTHFATRQVQIGRHGPNCRSKIKQSTTLAVLFVRCRQVPCKVHRKAGAPGAAGQSVHQRCTDQSSLVAGVSAGALSLRGAQRPRRAPAGRAAPPIGSG